MFFGTPCSNSLDEQRKPLNGRDTKQMKYERMKVKEKRA